MEVLSHVLTADPDVERAAAGGSHRWSGRCCGGVSRRIRVGDCAISATRASRWKTGLSERAGCGHRQRTLRRGRALGSAYAVGRCVVRDRCGHRGRRGVGRARTQPTSSMKYRLELITPPTVEAGPRWRSRPDGETVAFVASSDGQSRLWLRELATAFDASAAGHGERQASRSGRRIVAPSRSRSGRPAEARGYRARNRSRHGGVRRRGWAAARGIDDGTILYRPPGPGSPAAAGLSGRRDPGASRRRPARKRTDPFAPQFLPGPASLSASACDGGRPSRAVDLGLLGGSDPPRRLVDAQAAAHTPRQDISCSCARARCTAPTV